MKIFLFTIFFVFTVIQSCTNSSQQHRQKATVCSDEILGQFYIKDRNVDVDSMRITTIANNRETQSVLYYGLRNSKNGYVHNKSFFKIEDSLNVNNQYLIELYSNGKVYKNVIDQIDYRREIVYNGSVCKVRSYVLNNNFKKNYMNGFELELIEGKNKAELFYDAMHSKDTAFFETRLNELDTVEFELFMNLSLYYRYRIFDFDNENKCMYLHEEGLSEAQQEVIRFNTMYVLRTHFKSCILFRDDLTLEISNRLNQEFVFYDRPYNQDEQKEIFKIINEPCMSNPHD